MSGERITVRVGPELYEEMQAVVESQDMNQSQLVREGIRRAVDRRQGNELADTLDRLEDATTDVERQATRLERLPLE